MSAPDRLVLRQAQDEANLERNAENGLHPELVEGCGPRAAIVALACTWLATPYRHQASVKGVGCDCLGLIRGVWRELYGAEPEALPAYRPDWAETGGRETMLEAARRHMHEIPLAALQPGDVLLFRMATEAVVKHAAILTDLPTAADPQPRMIHAYWGRAVVESWIGPWWRRRLAFAFRFPFLPRGAGEGNHEVVEGAAAPSPIDVCAAPSVSVRIRTDPPPPLCEGGER